VVSDARSVAENTPRLAARDVVFGFRPGGPPAVDHVSFALDAGRITVLVGPNGAGKSTILRLLAGLLRPDRGEVLLGDAHGAARPLLAHTARERARAVGFVPQSLDAIPATDVEDFVTGGRYAHLGFWRRPSSGDRRAVDEALAACGLADLRERSLAELSGGERQRALVARALAQDTANVLCDEPTASLDPDHALAVCDLLAGLAARGAAVLLVTHALDIAAQYADRVLLLHEGRVHADGTVAEVFVEDVLQPVYGPRLCTLELPNGRPLVVPTR
jgi:iron complex transport system ATP-binding protein